MVPDLCVFDSGRGVRERDAMSLAPESSRMAFEKFHRENPDVWGMYCAFASAWQRAHPGAIMSISMITERIRWEVDVVTVGDAFKVNNNYRAYYARLLMEANPEWKFRTREKK